MDVVRIIEIKKRGGVLEGGQIAEVQATAEADVDSGTVETGEEDLAQDFEQAVTDSQQAYEDVEEVFQALEEFIFNLSHEELMAIRREMDDQKLNSITRKRIESLVGPRRFCPDLSKVDPREVLRFYKERKEHTDHRRRSLTPGPQRTIEEYLSLYLLEHSSSL